MTGPSGAPLAGSSGVPPGGAPPGSAPPGSAPLVFVDDLDAPVLDDADRHHLERVLRLRAGDAITIADGAGRWRPARFGGRLELTGDEQVAPRRMPQITVAFAVLKGDRPELVTQKLTELGVDRIVPFVAARGVVRWDGQRGARHVERLRRVAREAAMQCRRAWLPVVEDLAPFAEVAGREGACGAERGGGPLSLARPTVLVGPEGGWTSEERAALAATVDLGDHVLRAETAAIVAGAELAGLRRRGSLSVGGDAG